MFARLHSGTARGGTVVGSCLAAAGIAVTGMGLAAPAHASQAPATPAHVARVAAAPMAASTVSTKFRWADGSAVKATVVSGSGAKEVAAADISQRTVAWESWDYTAGVLPDGRAVGIKGGKLYWADAKGKLHLYNSGWAPQVDHAWVQGNRAYGIRYYNTKQAVQFFDLGTVGGKINQDAPWLAGESSGSDYAVLGGRVYWDRLVMSKGEPVGIEVVSRPMKGGAVRVEAKGASGPSLVDGGVGVVTHKVQAGNWSGGPVTGAKVLGGKSLVSFAGAWPSDVGPDAGPATLVLSGHTLAAANVGGNGTIVMDTRAKKAWWVSAPTKGVAVVPSIGSNRVVWQWANYADGDNPVNRQIAVFDAGKVRKLTAKGSVSRVYANGGAVAYAAFALTADARPSFAAMKVR